MKKTFEIQKDEVRDLHKKYEEYLSSEYAGRDYSSNLSNPDNFVDGIYYHQANSGEERDAIIINGFDVNKLRQSNCGAGRGLYCGRDKQALVNFYSENINHPRDFTLEIKGHFHFLDLLDDQDFLQKNKANLEDKVLAMGYDGIRYYDPDATGEEFVLFDCAKILIEK